MCRRLRLASRCLIAVTILALGAGCSGSSGGDESSDDSAITAGQANREGHNLKEHVLSSYAAGDEGMRALGISTWDVFAGTDEKTGFSGSVFYAADNVGDVKYVFAVDVVTKGVTFGMLDKAGTATGDKLDAKTQEILGREVDALKPHIAAAEAARANEPNGAVECGKALASAAFDIVTSVGIGTLMGGLILANGIAKDARNMTDASRTLELVKSWIGVSASYVWFAVAIGAKMAKDTAYQGCVLPLTK